jgi:hypothetical protein
VNTIHKYLINFTIAVDTAINCTVLCAIANAQCYFDPFTGQRICTIAPDSGAGTRSQALDSRPGTLWVALDPSAHCRISVGDGSVGSGVLVSRDDATGLVLTCSHLFDDATGRIIVSFPNGKRYAAKLLERDQGHDLAALSIRRPDIEPLSLSESSPAGILAACGFGPNGQFRSIHGNITGHPTAVGAQYPSLTIQGAVRPGDSGGGVLNAAGQLVGIVWGQRDGMTYATCGQPVRDFLKRVLVRSPVDKQEPIANGPDHDPQSPAPSPQIDWPAWTTEMESRIQSLDQKKQDKGDYLEPGDLNGYVRVDDAPPFDESQFARRDELHNRFESIEKHITTAIANRVGLFEGLSLGKLLAATLGLSGPFAAAAIIACGLAGNRTKKRGATPRVPGKKCEAEARSPLAAQTPIAVDSPPPPQRIVPETHYVSVEKDSFAKAHQWASEQVARKYPGATELLQAQDSLIKQYIAAQ